MISTKLSFLNKVIIRQSGKIDHATVSFMEFINCGKVKDTMIGDHDCSEKYVFSWVVFNWNHLSKASSYLRLYTSSLQLFFTYSPLTSRSSNLGIALMS